jgi:ectoine hydroxylase-related dioxygenase (phytanoyl-CoA dioxygenase family)
MSINNLLTNQQKEEFNVNGVIVLKNFFDIEGEIQPIQKAIYEIIGLVMKRHSVSISREPFDSHNFDSGYLELVAINRKFGGEVYDLVKQVPPFLRLISSAKSEKLFCHLRGTDLPGIGASSYGIRIDNPYEDKFRSQWHQEFLFQPQSLDGIVFWTPLLRVTEEMGPVIVCQKSHRDGLCIYSKSKAYAEKIGAYTIGISDEESVIAKYHKVAPLTSPGDLILMDFLTIHQSGFNTSDRSRWSVQSRFFNFKEETGMRIGWRASVTAGTEIQEIFPDNFTER